MPALPEPLVFDGPHPLQVKAWREMGGSGRSELAAELRRKARGWKRDALRAQNPTWSDERLERELAGIYLRGHTYLFSLFVRPLHGSGLRYMVSGSLASVFLASRG